MLLAKGSGSTDYSTPRRRKRDPVEYNEGVCFVAQFEGIAIVSIWSPKPLTPSLIKEGWDTYSVGLKLCRLSGTMVNFVTNVVTLTLSCL